MKHHSRTIPDFDGRRLELDADYQVLARFRRVAFLDSSGLVICW